MAETYKKLVQELVDSSNDTLLTVAANTTVIIKSMRAVNTTGTAATLKLFHDGTAAVNLIIPFVTIAANGWGEFEGTIIMEAADTLVGISGTNAAINLTESSNIPVRNFSYYSWWYWSNYRSSSFGSSRCWGY